MVTLHEVITFLVSMQISISSLQTHRSEERRVGKECRARGVRCHSKENGWRDDERTGNRHQGRGQGVVRDPRRDLPDDVCFFSSRRRHTRSVSAFLLNRSSDLTDQERDYFMKK